MKRTALFVVLGFLFVFLLSNSFGFELRESLNAAFDANGELTAWGIEKVNEINSVSGSIPDEMRAIFGDERINIAVEAENGEEILGCVILRDGKIIEAKKAFLSNPTINARTTEGTVKEIAESESQVLEMQKALNDGRITYEPVGVVATIKVTVIKILNSIFSFFTGMASLIWH